MGEPPPGGRPTDTPTELGTEIETQIERIVVGGSGLGRDVDGKVVLVAGALPNEHVRAQVTEASRSMSHAALIDVLQPSPDRRTPPCPACIAGCGGCDLQHVIPSRQPHLKADIVLDALSHLSKIDDLEVRVGATVSPLQYRTTVRCAVDRDSGRAGFRIANSHDVIVPEECLTADSHINEIMANSVFPSADEVTIRVARSSGEAIVVVSPTAVDATVPENVILIGADELKSHPREPYWIHEVINSHRFRVSAGSFFQSGTETAATLVDAVLRGLGEVRENDHLVDLYGGVGLLSATAGANRVTLVERSPSATADARVNLEHLDARIRRASVERWRPSQADLVIADPARAGLKQRGVHAIAHTKARRAVLVNCDPAAMARDVKLMTKAGYSAQYVEVVDMFPHTHHIETVTVFDRNADS